MLCAAILMPTSIGYQDLAALIAQQPAVTERWRQHIRTSTFGTIHAATFSFPRPMGASIPDPYFTQLASVDPRALEVTGSISLEAPIATVTRRLSYEFPQVDRSRKGDRLPWAKAPVAPANEPGNTDRPGKKDQTAFSTEPAVHQGSETTQPAAPQSRAAPKGDRAAPAFVDPADSALNRAVAATTAAVQAIETTTSAYRRDDATVVPVVEASPPQAAPEQNAEAPQQVTLNLPVAAPDQAPAVPDNVPVASAPLNEPAATSPSAAVTTSPAETAPLVTSDELSLAPAQNDHPVTTSTADDERVVDSLVKFTQPGKQNTVFFGAHAIGYGQGEMQPWQPDEVPTLLAAPHVDPEIKRTALDSEPDETVAIEDGGETVAPKGEVTGDGARPRTPAERLNLSGASRTRHHKCLANAIYFEARGEVERGQMAVAQVVLNRAFSGYYPGNVCDVVYQNAHRHLACQFTFACDNHRDVVNDPKAWSIATRIADEALDGKFWLPEVGKATHYHANYVRPWWARTMNKHARLGVHIFYRPRRWGEGEEIPVWGDRLEVTGSIKSDAGTADDNQAETQPAARRSIFDPVDEIEPGG